MLEANPGVTDPSASAPSPSAAPSATPTPSPTPNPTPAPAASAPDASAAPVVDPVTGEPAAPTFQPDWKFKVKDKEFEIDEWARGIAKDEDTYKKLKRVWERSHGLDEVVSSRDQLKGQIERVERYGGIEKVEATLQEHAQIARSLNEITHYFNSGDLDSFFARLKIPFDTIFNYVRSKHQQAQLPPEVQQELEKARQARVDAYNYQQRLLEVEENQAQTETQGKLEFINSVISSKAGDVAQRFNDANGGNPDAFRNYVIFRAQQLQNELKRQVTVEEAVDRVREDVARLMGIQAAPAPTPNQIGNQPGQNNPPPVIPNVKAGAQSPVRQPVKSVDDLKKLASQL